MKPISDEKKRAPVQGFSAGIPWELHLRAYDAYCEKYGSQTALIENGCRGGFHTSELDVFVPGWRDEISVIARLEAAEAEIARLQRLVKFAHKALIHAQWQIAHPDQLIEEAIAALADRGNG